MSAIKFYVIEDDETFSLSQMSEPECFAIEQCVYGRIPEPEGNYWFEIDTCLFEEDDESEYGLVRCCKENPNPKDGSERESKIPHQVPKELLALHGKTFRVYPVQYGLSPWGKKVEIRFESFPQQGVKASDLIQAALQTQKVN